MNILVLGSGGREHALVWKLKQSAVAGTIWCVPGNGGIARDCECLPVNLADVGEIVALAARLQPNLTIVGPELPLVNGVADAFAERKWHIVAPSRQAAQLEGSKIFSKEFLQRHNIPTAKSVAICDTPGQAHEALRTASWPLVIKADGLCAGKGVLVADNPVEARDFIDRAMIRVEFGAGGRRILLEEALHGEELSFIVVTDGQRYAPLVPTRDHKRVFDGNRGPNTGGMGAYSTDDLLPSSLRETIISSIVEPTLQGLAKDGIHYRGFLYFGLMLTKSGPKVLEFNCRLGDPETQAIVARMDFDFAETMMDVARGRLDASKLRWKSGASICVVLTSGGYPGKFETGKEIHGLAEAADGADVQIFHSGSAQRDGALVTSGGRVLGVTAASNSINAARAAAYQAAQKVSFDGMHYRKDIAAASDRAQIAQN